MKVIVCVDNKGGMLFNQRRQSRDRELITDIEWFVGKGVVRCNAFSAELFGDSKINPEVSEEFLDEADDWDFCFVENKALVPYMEKIQQLVVYQWNRDYPADVFLDLPIEQFLKVETVEFAGKSHEKITRQVYVR